MTEAKQQSSALERHAQTVIGIIVVGVMSWVGVTTSKTATEVAVLATQISYLQNQVTELREGTKDRYTRVDAARDFGFRDTVLADLQSRVDRLESATFFEGHHDGP